MENLERIIKIAAPLMAVIVPCILLAGYSYHIGYIMAFGLSSDLIPKTMTDVLVESWYVGVMAMAWLTSKWLYLLVYVVLICLIVVITFFWARNQILKGNTWLFQEINKDFQGKVILGVTQWHWVCLGEAFGDLFSLFSAPVFFIAIIGLFTAFPFKDANDYALKQLELFKEKGCESNDKKISCVYLIDTEKGQDNILVEGLLVSANEKRIAIYNKKLEIWPILDTYIIKQKGVMEITEVEPKE